MGLKKYGKKIIITGYGQTFAWFTIYSDQAKRKEAIREVRMCEDFIANPDIS